MNIAPEFANWLALQANINAENIELARQLIDSLPQKDKNLFLVAAYYGNIDKDEDNYSTFSNHIRQLMAAQNIELWPLRQNVDFGTDDEDQTILNGWLASRDGLNPILDTNYLCEIILTFFDAHWLAGWAVYTQNYESIGPKFSLETWQKVLLRQGIIDDASTFNLPLEYEYDNQTTIPKFVYQLQDLKGIDAEGIAAIDTAIYKLDQLEYINLNRLNFLKPQQLDLAHFPQLHTIQIEYEGADFELQNGHQVTTFKWHYSGNQKHKTLPSALKNMRHLKHLQLLYPTKFGLDLPDYEELEHLYISCPENQFMSDKRLLAFRHCERFLLHSHPSNTLPHTLSSFQRLAEFTISVSGLRELPPLLGDLPLLRQLEIHHALITKIDENLLARLLGQLDYLYISTNPKAKKIIEAVAKSTNSACVVDIFV